jgi:hypothetical protein
MLALLMCVIAGPAAAQDNSSLAGLYTINMVNKRALPAATWTRTMSDTTCATATQNGTMMMDSKGRYAVLLTERDRCTRGTRRWTAPDVSTLFTGTYTTEGDNITFIDPSGGTAARAVHVDGRLTVTVEGMDPFTGQTATYVLRKQRPTRAGGK